MWRTISDRNIHLEFPTTADAIAIFREHQKVDTRNHLSDQAIGKLVNTLDHLPLAIELAVRWLELSENNYEIDKLQALIQEDMRALDYDPNKSLHSTFKLHYDSLNLNAQKVINWLSVFAQGPIRLSSILAVLDKAGLSEKEIFGALQSLKTRSLIYIAEEFNSENQNIHRYEVPQLFYQFISTKLREIGEEKKAENSHLHYYLSQTKSNASVSRDAHDNLDAIFPNIKIALKNAIKYKKRSGSY